MRSLRKFKVQVIRLRHPREGPDLHAGQYLDRIDVKLACGEIGYRVLRGDGILIAGEEVKDIVFELLSPITIPLAIMRINPCMASNCWFISPLRSDISEVAS